MYPENLRYTKTHEWVRIEGKTLILGITYYAQDKLTMHGGIGIVYAGTSLFAEVPKDRCVFPEIGAIVQLGDEFMIVESSKATAGIVSPATGKIIAINEKLTYKANLDLIHHDPYGEGWLVKIEVENFDPSALMDAQAYQKFLAEEEKIEEGNGYE